MSRSFSVRCGDDALVEFQIAEPHLRAQGLSLTTWTASFILASLLHKLDVDAPSSDTLAVLELGAGTGLVGLAAAALWKAPVVLTDLPPIVPGLAGNIKLNAAIIKDLVRCGSLDWDSPDVLLLENGQILESDKDKAAVILAADTIYSEEHPEMLSNTILQWLAPVPTSRVIITMALRVAYLDQIRELWELLEAGGLETVAEGQERANVDEWDDEALCEWSVWRWKSTPA